MAVKKIISCTRKYTRCLLGGFLLLPGVVSVSVAAAAKPASPSVPLAAGTLILDDDSYLRTYLVYKTPVFVTKGGEIKPTMELAKARDGHQTFDLDRATKQPKPVPGYQSSLPPEDWFKPEFDDSSWERRQAPFEENISKCHVKWANPLQFAAPGNSLVCLRAAFFVADPAKAADLKFSLEYVGGVVVYANGQELVRDHLPKGKLAFDTMAENYPDDLYVAEKSGLFMDPGWKDYWKWLTDKGADNEKDYTAKLRANFERRYRKLADITVPGKLLRKGDNLLAVEIHRSPVNEGAMMASRPGEGADVGYYGNWACVGVRNISLTASADSGVAANIARPKGIQVWNCSAGETLRSCDYGAVGDVLRPVLIEAVRNGVFSGRLAISADQAIKGLKVTVGDLSQTGGGKIPASAVSVRCAVPMTPSDIRYGAWTPYYRCNGLLDTIPSQIDVNKNLPPADEGSSKLDYFTMHRNWSAGALAPIWVTIHVPKDAKPGQYAGTVTVSADGLTATQVPLKLTVFDWALPDPKDFRTHTMGYVSAESEARYYGVPLWSDRNFELLGKSLALMSEINSRQVLADLAINFYSSLYDGLDSNSESLVRWIKQADGSFKYDFTVLDKYLDTVAKYLGKPLPLRFNCWGVPTSGESSQTLSASKVTLLDPATGKLSELEQPQPGTEESYKFWKPVLDEVRKKVEARGWFDVTCLGHNQYCGNPTPEVFGVATRIWPESIWGITHHGCSPGVIKENGVNVQVRYAEGVWSSPDATFRGYRNLPMFTGNKSRRGAETMWCRARTGELDSSPLDQLRQAPERRIMESLDGGQMGADYFPVRKPNSLYVLYGSLGNCRGGLGPHQNGTLALLAPGPDGAVTTERFEAYREGVQNAEAVLFLEKALEDKKISGDLAERVNKCLDERSNVILHGWPCGRFERDEKLLALVGEVAKNMEVKQ